MKNSIKSSLYTLAIGLLALSISSCSRGYGCPYNSSIQTEENVKSEHIVFIQTTSTEDQNEVACD